MLIARFDNEKANEAIQEGLMAKQLEELVARLQPEAAYFTTAEGDRTAFLVFDLDESWKMPVIGEPLFAAGAKLTLRPVMNLEDLQKGLAALGH
ncbi:hypothetical protein [Yinghuangia seranimata]|uniref:hypothetical protein n=1 Tax=Yinghuangia seranimata TaxID=408067 RepID=UPI0031BBA0AC